ncbi:MAG: fatty acid desaturase [Phycisphaerales bacterium]
MALPARTDRRLAAVAWRDLVPLRPFERLWECTLSLPWLAGSWWCFQHGWWWLGLPCSFMFFLTGLRQSHNAQHACLGIGRAGHHAMLTTLSVLMLASAHAVRTTHMHHHRRCLREDDVEAGHTGWPWWRALLLGPVFPVRLHQQAWRIGTAGDRAWVVTEVVLIAGVISAAATLPILWLRWHVGAMLAGECLTGFFAVWIVHHDCHHDGQIARTQRGWFSNFMTYSMLYHLEHHLFPAVPTCHLRTLAGRLDAAAPEFRRMQVIP